MNIDVRKQEILNNLYMLENECKNCAKYTKNKARYVYCKNLLKVVKYKQVYVFDCGSARKGMAIYPEG